VSRKAVRWPGNLIAESDTTETARNILIAERDALVRDGRTFVGLECTLAESPCCADVLIFDDRYSGTPKPSGAIHPISLKFVVLTGHVPWGDLRIGVQGRGAR
jgi:hypothetical protein